MELEVDPSEEVNPILFQVEAVDLEVNTLVETILLLPEVETWRRLHCSF